MKELQYNSETGKPYEGHNQIELQKAKDKNGFQSNEWITFLQAKNKGLKIKKGSKGVHIISPFLDGQKIVEDEKGKDKKVEYSYPRHYTVFNLEQCEKQNEDNSNK